MEVWHKKKAIYKANIHNISVAGEKIMEVTKPEITGWAVSQNALHPNIQFSLSTLDFRKKVGRFLGCLRDFTTRLIFETETLNPTFNILF